MGAVKSIIEVDMSGPAAVSIGGHSAGGRVTAIRLVEKSLCVGSAGGGHMAFPTGDGTPPTGCIQPRDERQIPV